LGLACVSPPDDLSAMPHDDRGARNASVADPAIDLLERRIDSVLDRHRRLSPVPLLELDVSGYYPRRDVER
jgi:hypothetical protein